MRQDFWVYFCRCIFQSNSRDLVYTHITSHRRNGTHPKTNNVMHMVDRESYGDFTKLMQWTTLPPFRMPPPNQTLTRRTMPDANPAHSIHRWDQPVPAVTPIKINCQHCRPWDDSLEEVNREIQWIRELLKQVDDSITVNTRDRYLNGLQRETKGLHTRCVISGTFWCTYGRNTWQYSVNSLNSANVYIFMLFTTFYSDILS